MLAITNSLPPRKRSSVTGEKIGLERRRENACANRPQRSRGLKSKHESFLFDPDIMRHDHPHSRDAHRRQTNVIVFLVVALSLAAAALGIVAMRADGQNIPPGADMPVTRSMQP
jgi:hypothetical protein